ncbi:MAG: hypothetical protein ACJAYU_004951 [Bradymonadia bacterium]|jgi:hypothetical protein
MKLRLIALSAVLALAACGDDDDPVIATDLGTTDTGTTDAGTTDTGTADIADDAGETDTSEADAVEDAQPDTPAGMTLDDLHVNIFADSCGGGFCHLNGQEAGSINLDPSDELMDALLGPSTVSGLNLIEPGDPSLSYLYLKASGEFGAVGGSGSQMPLGAPALTDEQLQMIADWITAL